MTTAPKTAAPRQSIIPTHGQRLTERQARSVDPCPPIGFVTFVIFVPFVPAAVGPSQSLTVP
jgi:hypothetical protein